ncbi:MAG: GGDEF domain-containing protein [Deltaproteobacteria bacterium]|nr:GGDEF domain-containing protein [Deltaproteobacteria bacterium]
MSKSVLVARPVWPVLNLLAGALSARGSIVERSASWEALFGGRAAGEDIAAAFLGEYGEVDREEETLRRFRQVEGAGGVPVFLVGGKNAIRWERRFRAAGADQVFSADLSASEILERSKPLCSLGDMYRNAMAANRELRGLSKVDDLTGLPNRRQFKGELDRTLEMVRRIGRPLSCILSDIDDIRSVNETHGVPAGDSVIRQFGEILNGAKRRYDTLARLGGDEFAWLLVGADAEQAVRAAWRAHRKVSESLFDGAHASVRVTATWGVASLSPEAERTGRSLMENADRALYWGKESGKNVVRCYPPGKTDVDG